MTLINAIAQGKPTTTKPTVIDYPP